MKQKSDHGDRSNPQYGLSVVIAAMWYPTVVTPAVTVPLAWLTIRSRCRGRGSGGGIAHPQNEDEVRVK